MALPTSSRPCDEDTPGVCILEHGNHGGQSRKDYSHQVQHTGTTPSYMCFQFHGSRPSLDAWDSAAMMACFRHMNKPYIRAHPPYAALCKSEYNPSPIYAGADKWSTRRANDGLVMQ